MTDCPCDGTGWVCEAHSDKPSDDGCGIGRPCRCNPEARLPADYQSIASTGKLKGCQPLKT